MKRQYIRMIWLLLLPGFLLACASHAAAVSPTSTASTTSEGEVRVVITDTTITSSRNTFYAGRAYKFVVTNKGKLQHDFLIRRRVKGFAPERPTEQGVLYALRQIQPGATKHFSYAFSLANKQSDVLFATQIPPLTTDHPGPEFPVDVK